MLSIEKIEKYLKNRKDYIEYIKNRRSQIAIECQQLEELCISTAAYPPGCKEEENTYVHVGQCKELYQIIQKADKMRDSAFDDYIEEILEINETEEELNLVFKALNRLPPREYNIMSALYLSDCTWQWVCHHYQVSSATVQRIRKDAIKKIYRICTCTG